MDIKEKSLKREGKWCLIYDRDIILLADKWQIYETERRQQCLKFPERNIRSEDMGTYCETCIVPCMWQGCDMN